MPRRPRRTRDSHPLVRVQPALDAGDDRLEFTGGAMIRAGHPRRNGLHRRGKRHTAELHVSENKTRPETLLRDQDGDPTSEKTNKGPYINDVGYPNYLEVRNPHWSSKWQFVLKMTAPRSQQLKS